MRLLASLDADQGAKQFQMEDLSWGVLLAVVPLLRLLRLVGVNRSWRNNGKLLGRNSLVALLIELQRRPQSLLLFLNLTPIGA